MIEYIKFLRARLAEADQVARAAHDAGYNNVSEPVPQRWHWSPGNEVISSDHGVQLITGVYGDPDDGVATHIVEWEPLKIMDLVASMGQALDELERLAAAHPDATASVSAVIQQLAYPWRSHPDHPDHTRIGELRMETALTIPGTA